MSIHPFSFDTRYFFHNSLGIMGVQMSLYLLSLYPPLCITECKIFILHKSLVIIVVQLRLYPLSLYPSSFIPWYKIFFIKIPWVSSVSSWVFILYPGIWLVLAPLLAASSSFSSTSITSSHLLSSSSSNKGKYKYNQLHTLAFACFNFVVKINQFSSSFVCITK